jgi:hypothetical protein
MTKPTITIRQATTNDKDLLTGFRISQFKTAKEFEVNNFQDFSKQQGQNLIIENGKEIISEAFPIISYAVNY